MQPTPLQPLAYLDLKLLRVQHALHIPSFSVVVSASRNFFIQTGAPIFLPSIKLKY